MITFIKGNLLSSPDRIIAHGCNCRGAFGSGVARAIARKYPKARREYRKVVTPVLLGTIQPVECGDKIVVNMFTQLNYGRVGRFVDYEAIMGCMRSLYDFAEESAINSVSIPRVGAGLGGGDWRLIEKLIRRVWDNNIDLNIYSL